MVRKNSWLLAGLTTFLLILPVSANGQGVTTGAVTGTVTDAQGAPLAGAQVQIVNRATGFSTGTLTRSTGQYLVQGLETGGPYTINITSLGFQQFSRNDIFVRLSASTRVDAQLGVQAVAIDQIDVTVSRTA